MFENSIRLLNAIKKSWLESGNIEAEDRGKYLAKLLDENAQNVVLEKWKSHLSCDPPKKVKPLLQNVVFKKWKSYLRCDPPKEVKPLLQNELERYIHTLHK